MKFYLLSIYAGFTLFGAECFAGSLACSARINSETSSLEVREVRQEINVDGMSDVLMKTETPFSTGENVAIRILTVEMGNETTVAVGISAYAGHKMRYDFSPGNVVTNKLPFSRSLNWNGLKNPKLPTTSYRADVSCWAR